MCRAVARGGEGRLRGLKHSLWFWELFSWNAQIRAFSLGSGSDPGEMLKFEMSILFWPVLATLLKWLVLIIPINTGIVWTDLCEDRCSEFIRKATRVGDEFQILMNEMAVLFSNAYLEVLLTSSTCYWICACYEQRMGCARDLAVLVHVTQMTRINLPPHMYQRKCEGRSGGCCVGKRVLGRNGDGVVDSDALRGLVRSGVHVCVLILHRVILIAFALVRYGGTSTSAILQ